MTTEVLHENGTLIALPDGGGTILADAQTALDLMLSVQWETGADRIALAKEILPEAFFVLSSGLAGEILQKLVNYHIKVAVYGDFSRYTSKPLHDFIYESNKGRDVFFVATKEEAVRKLAQAGET